jgi:HAE1 family hydrophobic/amphiphilic exporter-1
MNLSELFIRRPVMTAVLTLSAIAFGSWCYWGLPVNDLPVVDYPVIQVSVGYPGAGPETMANNIATPLERQFMQIPGLEMVTSKSRQGSTSLTLQFALNKNIDAAATDVQTAISQSIASLPTDLPSQPTNTKTNPNDQPIIYLALTSNSMTPGKLYDYASTQVGQRISILPGVSRVEAYGAKSAVRIKADPSVMASRGMTIDDLTTAITNGTSYSGAGQFDGAGGTTLLRPNGQIDDADGYKNLVVGGKATSPTYLQDVARVADSLQDERLSLRLWARGHEASPATVILAISRQTAANTVDVAKRIHAILPQISAELPPTVRLLTFYDRSETIVNSINDVQETLLIAFALVIVVIFMFLGRATDTLIPAVALPLSLLLTFIAMHLLGYSLDNLSLMALTLAIGFLVDDAIVFLENTVRRMERGEKAIEASINSAKEISFTIVSMTISLAAVFIPLVFMPGLVGRVFREFAVTIVVAIFASALVSLTLTPLMCARLLKDRGHGAKSTWMERLVGGLEKRILAVYGISLTWFLKHRWISAMIWVACLAGTVGLFALVPKAFLPVGDSGFLYGMLIGGESSSPDQMHALQGRADHVMQACPDVAMTFSLSGGQSFSSNTGILMAALRPAKERRPIEMINEELTNAFSTIPGAMCFVRPMAVLSISTGATEESQGQYAFSLSGINPHEIYEAAEKMMAKMREFPGFSTVSSDLFLNTPNLDIDIRRDQAKKYGVSEARVLSLLQNAYAQDYVYLIKKPNDQYQVILEVEDSQRSKAEDLSLLYIRSDDGNNLIPLDALISWRTSIGPQSVNHINQFTSVTIFFDLTPGTPIGDATDYISRVASEVIPPSIRGEFQGQALTFRDTVGQLLILMVVAVFVMYVILAILYESYLHPLTVLSSLPVALVGGLLTLYLFDQEASLYAFVGMFMLMGIVEKNGIMIVDFALQRVAAGESASKAIHDASIDRFRPIIMTTMAAVIGSAPIALGWGADGASRRPLGLVIVGGLIVSQFITLYVTPVLYLYLEDFQEKVLNRISFFRSIREHHEMPSLAQTDSA